MQNMSKIYKGHNSKITSTLCNQLALCNCRVKEKCPMNGKCWTMDAVYDCRVTSPEPRKIYFELAEWKWKTRYYNHKRSFNHKRYSNERTSYVWHLKGTLDEMVSSEMRHTLLKHLKKVSFLFVWKIGYYYLSKTIRTFK